MNSFMLKNENQKMQWVLIDANEKILGRLASQIVNILRGKDKPTFTPHADPKVGVIVTNIGKIKVTGNKAADKRYYWHTGHPGGAKYKTYNQFMQEAPDMPLMLAIKGMLPKNRMRKTFLTRVRIFTGEAQGFEAQAPTKIEI